MNDKIAILRFLKEGRWQNEKHRKTTHLSRPFFHFVEQSLQADIILTLDKFYDEKGERSLVCYLKQVEMHLAKIFDRVEINQQLAEIKNAEAILKKIEINRDKFYAHFDKKYFDSPVKLVEDAPISLNELSQLVSLTKAVVTRHHLVLKNTDYLFIELHDVEAFFNAASGYIGHLQDMQRAINA